MIRAEETVHRFHARHDALSRVYLYQISTRRTAFAKPFVWWIKDRLDLEAMSSIAPLIAGRHDFSRFTDKRATNESMLVEVELVEVGRDDDLILIRIAASHFLWKMVRKLVSALVEVGRGAMRPDGFKRLLDDASSPAFQPTASPSGLFLEAVIYPGETFDRSLQAIVPCLHGAVLGPFIGNTMFDEGKLIATLSAAFPRFTGGLGIGDDAAIMAAEGNLVATTDLLLEDVDFTAGTEIEHVIAKSLAANFSDVAAMGASPFAFLLTLGLNERALGAVRTACVLARKPLPVPSCRPHWWRSLRRGKVSGFHYRIRPFCRRRQTTPALGGTAGSEDLREPPDWRRRCRSGTPSQWLENRRQWERDRSASGAVSYAQKEFARSALSGRSIRNLRSRWECVSVHSMASVRASIFRTVSPATSIASARLRDAVPSSSVSASRHFPISQPTLIRWVSGIRWQPFSTAERTMRFCSPPPGVNLN